MKKRIISARLPTFRMPLPPANRPGFTVAMESASAARGPAGRADPGNTIFQGQRGAREIIRSGEGQTAVRIEPHIASDRRIVGAGRQAAERDSIGNKNRPAPPPWPVRTTSMHIREDGGRRQSSCMNGVRPPVAAISGCSVGQSPRRCHCPDGSTSGRPHRLRARICSGSAFVCPRTR